MANRSNIDIYLSAKYEIKDPNDVILRSGTVEFSVTPSELLKIVNLVGFTHTFTVSGVYPVRIDIISEGNIISTVSDAIHVAPSIRIEPSKVLTPTTVIPDGDKKIEIRIQIKGVEDKP